MEDWTSLASTIGYETEAAMLYDLYEEKQMSIIEIAKLLGMGTATIAHRLELAEVTKRSRGGANNIPKLRLVLHRLDQRLIFQLPILEVCKLARAHYSTVYKYKRGVQRNATVRGDQSSSRASQVEQPESCSSGSATSRGAGLL